MTDRARVHRQLAGRLSALDDSEILSGQILAVGIGGTTARLEVDGRPVFVKRVPLTQLERERPHWTGNAFELPGFYQYGIGSAGFGVWRELAAHQRATDWVLDGLCESFPLLHHWRVIETSPLAEAEEEKAADAEDLGGGDDGAWFTDVEEMAAQWDGHPGVRRRVEALASATATVVLVLEWIPQNLNAWLTAHPDRFDWADAQVHAVVDFMASRGMAHFDVHPGNVLCDGERVYVTDFGLATDHTFALDDREREFLERHRDYDRRNAERYLAPYAADGRYDRVALEMDGFYDRLFAEPKGDVRWPPTT